ncbi:MAG: GTPase [Symploca sp. SIO2E9]|nr:GTPase [Symploca sp. SIO2E9]
MTQNNQKFQAAAVGAKFNKTVVKFDKLLAEVNTGELTVIRKKLRKKLKAHREQGIISVAFVGQYSSGKSTIISALTGKRDIRIDADIATDKTASYDWNEIRLIDTPGLFTDRQDHDAITYDAIAKADLLVFCLTYMLFDSITAENFKKLAYEQGYRWKMMLIINKMSDEAGEEEQKITNYRKSLAEAIKPHRIDEFPICFIDAKDYCEGIDENEDFLLEVSRFQTFIDQLNNFVERRGSLAKFDTPVRIAQSCLDEALLSFSRDANEDSAYLEILTRLSRKVRQERDRLRTKVKSIILQMSLAVVQEGHTLAAAVGSNEDFDMLSKQAELNVRQHYEKVEYEMDSAVNAAVEEISQEVEEVMQSPLFQAFVARLESSYDISGKDVDEGIDFEQLKSQVNWLKKIGETAGVKITDFATRGFFSTAGDGFLRSIDVVGGGLHRGVLSVGKFVGFKFKPWQAVGIAKNIGNAAKFLGPVMIVASVVADLCQMQQEQEQQQQMADARREITSHFQRIAKDLEHRVEIQLSDFEEQVYGEIEQKISQARQEKENAIAVDNKNVKQLAEIRQDFELILRYITKASEK